jgi:hypothetical protein
MKVCFCIDDSESLDGSYGGLQEGEILVAKKTKIPALTMATKQKKPSLRLKVKNHLDTREETRRPSRNDQRVTVRKTTNMKMQNLETNKVSRRQSRETQTATTRKYTYLEAMLTSRLSLR